MKLTILNGSPKGEAGNTMQYCNLIKNRFPDHSYTLFNVGTDMGRIEAQPSHFEQIVESIALSDGLIGEPMQRRSLPPCICSITLRTTTFRP